MPKNLNIHAGVIKAFNEYGFDDSMSLDKAVAFRDEPDRAWCAVLLDLPGEGLIAVDFTRIGDSWEIQNDGSEPFKSIKEFMTTPLKYSFL